MRLGLLTDIHEHVEFLLVALARLARERVDQIVIIGDLFEFGRRIDETCRLLSQAKAIGVWGNHDFGACVNPAPELRARFTPAAMDFLATLRPQLEIDGCLFTHVEPWLNPNVLEDLWYFDDAPCTLEKAARSFNAVKHRHLFIGHHHAWLVMTPSQRIDWNGEGKIVLSDQPRYLSVIAPVVSGYCATFDTSSLELVPISCQL
jgi:hypothetical protein